MVLPTTILGLALYALANTAFASPTSIYRRGIDPEEQAQLDQPGGPSQAFLDNGTCSSVQDTIQSTWAIILPDDTQGGTWQGLEDNLNGRGDCLQTDWQFQITPDGQGSVITFNAPLTCQPDDVADALNAATYGTKTLICTGDPTGAIFSDVEAIGQDAVDLLSSLGFGGE